MSAGGAGSPVPAAVVAPAGPAFARGVLAALPVLALLIPIYAGVGRGLWNTWATNDNYSHGPLVPLVSAALIWTRRKRLAALPVRGSALGIALVLAACALLLVGLRSDIFSLQGWSIPLMAFGLSLALLGPAWTRALAFPIAFLVFMLTFPPLIVNQLSFALKEVTVRFAERAAELLGASLLRDGMTLYLPGGDLRVENPCSGLRSLLALLATGALFAGLQRGRLWRRLALFAAAVPVAMMANALRITGLILVGNYVGVPQAGGIVHDVSGYVLYALALAGLLAVRRMLTPRSESGGSRSRPALEAMGR